MLPDFVIIGAMKAASTFLHAGLREHPQVFMPHSETPMFRDPEYASFDIDALRALMEGGAAASRRGIKSPDYLGQEPCAERIFQHLGRVQLFVVLRDPVERAISAYFWRMRWGRIPIMPVEEGLTAILDGRLSDYPLAGNVLDWGLYARHLARYLRTWSLEDICVILDDDFRRDPIGSMRVAYGFLGVDESFTPSERARNEGIYSLPRLRFLRLRHRFVFEDGADRRSAPLTGPAGPASKVANAAFAATDRAVLRPLFGNSKPDISKELRARLRAYYASDLADLGVLLDRELPWSEETAAQQEPPR